MGTRKILSLPLTLLGLSRALCAQQPETLTPTDVIDKIIIQEQAEMASLRDYSPLIETYIQTRHSDKSSGIVPGGDRYFLGRASLSSALKLTPLAKNTRSKGGPLTRFFSMEFVPRGFLQMIFIDRNSFNRNDYDFSYVRREFLGEVRCLVFDVSPRVKSEKGRFVGRIWVEDQAYHIVRFNGTYNGSTPFSHYFSFDSWRQNSGKNQWLPALVFCEEGNVDFPAAKAQITPAFRAQTRLWGYSLGGSSKEQELSNVIVEGGARDQTQNANDYSPLQAERLWTRQAEDNVVERLEKIGLIALPGEIDKILDAIVNNLVVTNDLDIQPPVRSRVLITSTFESFSMGHTIVLSRGLLDVLPDEATLAALLAHELGHMLSGHRMDTQFSFFDRLHFNEKDTFRHFDFSRPPNDERAAIEKGTELLMKSPYKEQLAGTQAFLQALRNRSREIPNLISPHLGDAIPADWNPLAAAPSLQPANGKGAPATSAVVALPLGGRIKVDPFSGRLQLLKFKAPGSVPDYEKMPFEVTPVVLYLSRQSEAAVGSKSSQ